ncbi:MAG: hypothetical protein K2P93_09420 [Alphaproteobacteria bacterium]|nr:hypothetical protein [Alphaproteobacteria bacterium]
MNKKLLTVSLVLATMCYGIDTASAEPYAITVYLPKAGKTDKTQVGAATEAQSTTIQINLQNAFKDAGVAFTEAFKERKLVFADYEPYDTKTKNRIPWNYDNFPKILNALADGTLEFKSKK